MRRYDVVVVGAGPAGSMAAKAAAEAGANVFLVERKAEIGRPVQCGECVPYAAVRGVPLPRRIIAHSIRRMTLHFPSGEARSLLAPSLMIDRRLFDKHLAALAAKAGAEIALRTKAVELTENGLVVETRGSRQHIEATVIVGADGPQSTVARCLGLPEQSVGLGVQYEVVAERPTDEIELYFDPRFVEGYGWYLPKGQTANVGVGVGPTARDRAPEILELFLSDLRDRGRAGKLQPLAYTAGSVPIGGAQPARHGDVLLAGDAAGHTNPLNGAGIWSAMMAGRSAGRAAALSVHTGNPDALDQHEQDCSSIFGEAYARALLRRVELDRNWSSDLSRFERQVRRAWLGEDA